MTRAERKQYGADLSRRVALLMDALDACWSADGASCNLVRLQKLQPDVRAMHLALEQWRLGN